MKFLDWKILEPGGENPIYIPRRPDRNAVLPLFGCHPAAELECRMNRYRTRCSDASENGERCHGLTRQPTKRAIRSGENRLPHLQRGVPRSTRPQNDRNELCRAQRVRTEILEAFARTLRSGQLSNT